MIENFKKALTLLFYERECLICWWLDSNKLSTRIPRQQLFIVKKIKMKDPYKKCHKRNKVKMKSKENKENASTTTRASHKETNSLSKGNTWHTHTQSL